MQRSACIGWFSALIIACQALSSGETRSIEDAAAEIVATTDNSVLSQLPLKYAPARLQPFNLTHVGGLFEVLGRDGLTVDQRWSALRTLVWLEEPIVLERLFETAAGWCDERDRDDVPPDERQAYSWGRVMFDVFVAEAALSPVIHRVRFGEAVSRVVLHSLAHPRMSCGGGDRRLTDLPGRMMIERLTLTAEEKSALVRQTVEVSAYVHLFGASMLYSLLPHDVSALRIRLATSLFDGNGLDWQTAEALATVGDVGALTILRQHAARPDLAADPEVGSYHYASLSARIVGVQSRDNFIDFCASHFAAESTCWAWIIEWGVRLGLSRDELRECVNSVRSAYERRASMPQRPDVPSAALRSRAGLSKLREIAINRGVFSNADWPDVAEAREKRLTSKSGF